jgi:hypothetical protein
MPNPPHALVKMLECYDAGDAQPFNIFAGRLDKLKEEKRRKPPKRRKRQPLPRKSPPRKKRPRAQAPRHWKPTSARPSWSNNQHERHDDVDLSLAAAVQRPSASFTIRPTATNAPQQNYSAFRAPRLRDICKMQRGNESGCGLKTDPRGLEMIPVVRYRSYARVKSRFHKLHALRHVWFAG